MKTILEKIRYGRISCRSNNDHNESEKVTNCVLKQPIYLRHVETMVTQVTIIRLIPVNIQVIKNFHRLTEISSTLVFKKNFEHLTSNTITHSQLSNLACYRYFTIT